MGGIAHFWPMAKTRKSKPFGWLGAAIFADDYGLYSLRSVHGNDGMRLDDRAATF